MRGTTAAKGSPMKRDVHPKSKEVTITCSCGNTFVTPSTMDREKLFIDVCSQCHPFYTGTQKLTDSGGRVDKFRQKYGMKKKTVVKKKDE